MILTVYRCDGGKDGELACPATVPIPEALDRGWIVIVARRGRAGCHLCPAHRTFVDMVMKKHGYELPKEIAR